MDHMRLVLDSSPVTLLRVMALQVLDGSHAVGSLHVPLSKLDNSGVAGAVWRNRKSSHWPITSKMKWKSNFHFQPASSGRVDAVASDGIGRNRA